MDAKRPTVCPFCKGGVPADLLQFGGNCPRCLLEIPGEEAPTDPGAVARQKAAADAAVKAKSDRKRNAIYGVLAAFAVAAVGAVVVVQAQQEKAARTYEMPDDLYLPPLQEAAARPAPDAPGVATASATPSAPNGRGHDTPRSLTALNAAPNLGDPNIAAALAAGTPPPSGSQQPISSGPRGSTANATIDAPLAMSTGGQSNTVAMDATPITVSAGDKPLSDESEVFAMIKQIMGRYNPQIQNCYNSRLKQVPDLAGGWKLSFAVQKDGSVKGVSVDPVGSHDTLLEACMAKTVAAWHFGRITYEQPVTKTIRFGSNGW